MPLTDNHRLAIRIDNLLRESQHEDGHFIKTKRIVWRILTSTDDPQLQILHQVVLDWIELLGNQGFPLEAFNPQSSADIIVRWKRATPRQPIWELIREMLVEYADYLRRTPYDADMKQLEFISRLQVSKEQQRLWLEELYVQTDQDTDPADSPEHEVDKRVVTLQFLIKIRKIVDTGTSQQDRKFLLLSLMQTTEFPCVHNPSPNRHEPYDIMVNYLWDMGLMPPWINSRGKVDTTDLEHIDEGTINRAFAYVVSTYCTPDMMLNLAERASGFPCFIDVNATPPS